MKICIFGAGAIGGYMGGRMARAGINVSLVARGPHLSAMQQNGLTIEDEDGRQTLEITATDDPYSLGPQDYVIISVKAISLAGANIAPLLGENTVVVTAMNGIPWWYYYGLPDGERHASLETHRAGTIRGRNYWFCCRGCGTGECALCQWQQVHHWRADGRDV